MTSIALARQRAPRRQSARTNGTEEYMSRYESH
jgi:hypothetical protein